MRIKYHTNLDNDTLDILYKSSGRIHGSAYASESARTNRVRHRVGHVTRILCEEEEEVEERGTVDLFIEIEVLQYIKFLLPDLSRN